MANGPSEHSLPKLLTVVAMNAESGCSRCSRRILLLEKAFLDENYAAICVHCAAAAYTVAVNLGAPSPPNAGEAANE